MQQFRMPAQHWYCVCVQAADALADPLTLREVCRSQREHVAHALAMLGQIQMAHLGGLLNPALLQRAHSGAGSLQLCLTLTRAAVEWLLRVRPFLHGHAHAHSAMLWISGAALSAAPRCPCMHACTLASGRRPARHCDAACPFPEARGSVVSP